MIKNMKSEPRCAGENNGKYKKFKQTLKNPQSWAIATSFATSQKRNIKENKLSPGH